MLFNHRVNRIRKMSATLCFYIIFLYLLNFDDQFLSDSDVGPECGTAHSPAIFLSRNIVAVPLFKLLFFNNELNTNII